MNDISNKTIYSLVILSVIISLFSIWVLLSELNSFNVDSNQLPTPHNTGKISLFIEKPKLASGSGYIDLEINPKIKEGSLTEEIQ